MRMDGGERGTRDRGTQDRGTSTRPLVNQPRDAGVPDAGGAARDAGVPDAGATPGAAVRIQLGTTGASRVTSDHLLQVQTRLRALFQDVLSSLGPAAPQPILSVELIGSETPTNKRDFPVYFLPMTDVRDLDWLIEQRFPGEPAESRAKLARTAIGTLESQNTRSVGGQPTSEGGISVPSKDGTIQFVAETGAALLGLFDRVPENPTNVPADGTGPNAGGGVQETAAQQQTRRASAYLSYWAAHELGHAMGAKDIHSGDGSDTIMFDSPRLSLDALDALDRPPGKESPNALELQFAKASRDLIRKHMKALLGLK